MGSGRGDRNQWPRASPLVRFRLAASMGSGRGDRNQKHPPPLDGAMPPLQWGPVVVTGIRSRRARRDRTGAAASMGSRRGDRNQNSVSAGSGLHTVLQWGGPVVVTGIRSGSGGSPVSDSMLQWGPVVVTGISSRRRPPSSFRTSRFNGVRSW